MKTCLNEYIIFNYINKELDEARSTSVAQHLADCDRCRNAYHTLRNKIRFVQEKLTCLAPDMVPEMPFVIPEAQTKKRKRSYPAKMFSLFRNASRPGWKKAIVFSALAACLLVLLFLADKSRPDYAGMFQHIVVNEQFYLAEPKQDLDDTSFYISFFDKEKMQVEIIRTTTGGETMSLVVIPLK